MTTKTMRLVKFGASWCGPCQAMAKAKTLEKFAEEHDDLELLVIDVDKSKKKADEYEVEAIPSFVFETIDGEELKRADGAMNKSQLERLYNKALDELEELEDKAAARDRAARDDDDEEEEDDED